jgi:hypothetical protein
VEICVIVLNLKHLNVKKQENGLSEMKHGPNDTFTVDQDALKAAWDRRNNGRRLFAKYYHNLWD